MTEFKLQTDTSYPFFLLLPHVSFLRKRLNFWFLLSYSKLVWNLCCSDFFIVFLMLGQL